jgi:hypothetical protein
MDEKDLDGTPVFIFKHDNWNNFIRSMDEEMLANYYECHQVYPTFGLV